MQGKVFAADILSRPEITHKKTEDPIILTGLPFLPDSPHS
jgi:hypothetical protein